MGQKLSRRNRELVADANPHHQAINAHRRFQETDLQRFRALLKHLEYKIPPRPFNPVPLSLILSPSSTVSFLGLPLPSSSPSVDALWNQSVALEQLDPLGEELLEAAGSGRTKDVIRLIDRGVDINYRDCLGWTALHFASRRGHTGVALALINRKADVHRRDALGLTPLHWATLEEDGRCVGPILRAGADINCKSLGDFTPLHLAANWANVTVALKLLMCGARKNLKDCNGRTPFDIARDCYVAESRRCHYLRISPRAMSPSSWFHVY